MLAESLASYSDKADANEQSAELITSPQGIQPEGALDAKLAHAWEELDRGLVAAALLGRHRDTVIAELAAADTAQDCSLAGVDRRRL